MKKITRFSVIALIASISLVFYAFSAVIPVKGWFLAGSNPQAYKIGVEHNAERNSNVAYLKSTKSVKGFGTIMQSFIPKEYMGKRVRLTGYIKSKDVKDWAGMWLRVDGQNKVLRFDNMQKRPIKGTTGWKKYEIVLDVPQDSRSISYGVLLAGPGTVWLDDLKFEIVDKSIAETKGPDNKPSDKPQNSDFEESQD